MEFIFGLFGFALAVASAAICWMIADRNAMNRLGWPLFGFFFPLLGLIVTVIVAMSKQKV